MSWSEIITLTFFIQLLSAGVRMGAPVITAAIGEIFAERAGVFNLSVEGVMLIGGFTGFLVAFHTKNLWLGILAAMIIGAIMGLIFSVWAVSLRSNQIVAGFAVLQFCTGLAIYFNRLAFPTSKFRVFPSIDRFQPVAIPVLSEIPILGDIFFKQNVLTYIFLLLVPITAVILYKTRFGLRVTAVGEYPASADTVGVSVGFIRYAAITVGGVLAGAAGAYYSLAELGVYNDTMIAGRGFIALGIVIFGRWNPVYALLGGLLFGVIDALQYKLQYLWADLPSQFLIMMPYVLTIFALLIGRQQLGPAHITKAYSRE